MKYCHKCGFYLKFEGTIYCPNCGVKLVYNVDEIENANNESIENKNRDFSRTDSSCLGNCSSDPEKYDVSDRAPSGNDRGNFVDSNSMPPRSSVGKNKNNRSSGNKPPRINNQNRNSSTDYVMPEPTEINIVVPTGYEIVEPVNYNIMEPVTMDLNITTPYEIDKK